jgi:hypothetical protein
MDETAQPRRAALERITILCCDPNPEAAWLRLNETHFANGSCPDSKKKESRVIRSDKVFLSKPILLEALDYGTCCRRSLGLSRLYKRLEDYAAEFRTFSGG